MPTPTPHWCASTSPARAVSASTTPASHCNACRAAMCSNGAAAPPSPNVTVSTGKTVTAAPRSAHDPYCFPPQLSDFDLHLFGEGKHWHAYRFLGAHYHVADGVPGVLFATWAPNAERVSVVGDFNHWDGRAPPDADPRRQRRLGAVHPRHRARRAVQIRNPQPRQRRDSAQGRSLRPALRGAPQHRVDRRRPQHLHLARQGLDNAPRAGGLAARALLDLRSASRFLAAQPGRRLPQLPRTGRQPGRIRQRAGLHAHRAAAGHRASAGRLLGLPGHRLFRAHQPLRHARRFPLLRRSVPSARHRRIARLGAGAFPQGRARPGALRRHARCTNTKTRAAANTATGAR